MDPGGDGSGETHDVGSKRCIVLRVIGRVIADDVDERRRGAARIVKIGQTVGEAGAEVQQGAGRLLRHAAIAVGHAGDGAFEQAEHGTDTIDPVERRDEMHLRGAGIGEANLDARRHQAAHQAFRAVHS